MKNCGEAEILQRVAIGELTIPEAAAHLCCTTRTIYRRVKRFRIKGEEGLVHGLIGRPSNRAMDPDLRERTISLFRELGAGKSLAQFVAALKRDEGIDICRESLRRWLLEAELWEAGKREKGKEAAVALLNAETEDSM